jgi:drug/metabolite transporter (DMT)-like permease
LTAFKWLIRIVPARTLLLSQLLISAIIMLPVAAAFWPPLTLPVLGLATASAVESMSGNFLLLFAYAIADSTRLAPLVYFQLIAATVLDWTVFGTSPDTLTLCGLVLIISAGVGAATLCR